MKKTFLALPLMFALVPDGSVRVEELPDHAKRAVEMPLKVAFAPAQMPPAGFDSAPLSFLSKMRVEEPLKAALAPVRMLPAGFGSAPLSPLSKMRVEEPLKAALQRSVGRGPGELPALDDAVRPGLVRWHASYADALAAASESGKPVFLFQLLGRLDAGFC
jgi:hypothetical protein